MLYMKVERIKPVKAWLEAVKNYMKRLGLTSADALDCHLLYLFMLGGRM